MKKDYLLQEIWRLINLIGKELVRSNEKDKIELEWDEARIIRRILVLCYKVLIRITSGQGVKEIRRAYKLANKMPTDK